MPEAVKKGARIGVMATLSTTLTPTKNTIMQVAREMNKHVELVDVLMAVLVLTKRAVQRTNDKICKGKSVIKWMLFVCTRFYGLL